MNLLTEAVTQMLGTENPEQRSEAEHHFIEILTFSTFDEIVGMLDKTLAEDWLGLPVWARNQAFRLACLLAPQNPEIRRRAAADLRCFGPDWDGEAQRLDKEAQELEEITQSQGLILVESTN